VVEELVQTPSARWQIAARRAGIVDEGVDLAEVLLDGLEAAVDGVVEHDVELEVSIILNFVLIISRRRVVEIVLRELSLGVWVPGKLPSM
jgi:hypothetical protein